jgi:hypothetical protein
MARDKAFERTDKGVDGRVEEIDRKGMYVDLLLKLEKELEKTGDRKCLSEKMVEERRRFERSEEMGTHTFFDEADASMLWLGVDVNAAAASNASAVKRMRHDAADDAGDAPVSLPASLFEPLK